MLKVIEYLPFDSLQIPPHDGYPCLWLYTSHYQGVSGVDYAHAGQTKKAL